MQHVGGEGGTGRLTRKPVDESRWDGEWEDSQTAESHNRAWGPFAAVGAAVLALALLLGHSTGAFDVLRPDHDAAEPEPQDAPDDTRPRPDSSLLTEFPEESVLFQNPLYATGRLASPPCPAPELDVHDADSMEHFLHTLTDCLDQAWTVQFAKAGLDFEPPERVFWRKPGSSPCRDYPSAAGGFYCRANKSIYLGVRDIAAKWKYSPESVVYASLLAHEYGHHVQGEAGILEYYHEQRRQESDPAQQSFWTRRSELQANCLAGVFLGSVQVTYPIGDSEYETLLEDAANTADREGSSAAERTHGSAHNSALWLERGLSHQTPGSCNTWTADESLLE